LGRNGVGKACGAIRRSSNPRRGEHWAVKKIRIDTNPDRSQNHKTGE
jgi:hypothetical protein